MKITGVETLRRLDWAIDVLKDVIEEPRTMTPFVRYLGTDINANFKKEGPGWAPLTPFTQMVRRNLGKPPEHPILHQTGALKATVASHLKDIASPTKTQGRAAGIYLSSRWTPRMVTITISGDKVMNHFGGYLIPKEDYGFYRRFNKSTGIGIATRIPARPFFFVHPTLASRAAPLLANVVFWNWKEYTGVK